MTRDDRTDRDLAVPPMSIRALAARHPDRRTRVLLAVGALSVFTLFLMAAFLKPANSGMGTHQQLGLPPCTSVVLWGIRCPTCGMTTSWSHLMHGQPGRAWSANPGGVLLWMFAAVSAIWMGGSSVMGRWLVGVPTAGQWLVAILPIVVLTLLFWLSKIWVN